MDFESGHENRNLIHFEDFNEIRSRLLLAHRFSLEIPLIINGQTYSSNQLDYKTAIQAFKESYQNFIHNKSHFDKIIDFLFITLRVAISHITAKQVVKLLEDVNLSITELLVPDYASLILQNIRNNNIALIPIRCFLSQVNLARKEHMEGLAIFQDRMLKINRGGPNHISSIRVYRIKKLETDAFYKILTPLINSLSAPVEQNNWDKLLNKQLAADKLNEIKRSGKGIGNGSWTAAKLFLFVSLYAHIFLFCKERKIKELDSHKVALVVSEYIYKLFTVEDRNRAVFDYFGYNNGFSHDTEFTIVHRIEMLKNHLLNKSHVIPFVEDTLLWNITLKSLNWLLSDYLRKGDIGAAHRLLQEELNNPFWNPISFAVRRNKLAVLELLSKNRHYVNHIDEHQNTALHLAAQYDRLEMAKILLKNQYKNQINVFSRNDNNGSIVHAASFYNRPEMLELYLNTEPSLIDLKTKEGDSALKIACDNEYLDIIKRLVAKGASLDGITASNYAEKIRKLLK